MEAETALASGRERSRRELLRALARAVPGIEEDLVAAFGGPLLKTSDVALLFGVSERCIRKWSDAGRLPCLRTPGGHRLFPAQSVTDALTAAARNGKSPMSEEDVNGSRS